MSRILVVDDEPVLLMTLAANLEMDGFQVQQASSAEEALTYLRGSTFDAVLTDIQMPGMNGVELFREIRKRAPEVPVVLMTAFAMEDLVRSALCSGAFTLLHKPFALDHAARTLSRAAQHPKVLVLDEAASNGSVSTVEALAACGLLARQVSTPEEAERLLGPEGADVCVIDLAISGLDTAAFARRLRQNHPDLVVIATSAQDVPEVVRSMASLGAYTFFRKPVEAPALAHAIARARGEPLRKSG